MTHTESIVEDAALQWFRELGYAIGHGPHLAPGEYAGGTLTPALSHGERESYDEMVQSRVALTLIPAFCLRRSPLRSGSQREKKRREAIRRLTPAIPEEAREEAREEALHGGILWFQPYIIA